MSLNMVMMWTDLDNDQIMLFPQDDVPQDNETQPNKGGSVDAGDPLNYRNQGQIKVETI